MKNIKSYCFILFAVLFIAGCEKNKISLDDATVIKDEALLKLGYFSPNSANPGVQLKVNGARVSYLLTNATPFPGGGYNTGGSNNSDYVAIKPGETKITLSIPKRGTNEDSVVVLDQTISLAGGKKYSMFTSDSIPNIQSFMVEDVFTTPDSGYSKVRFTNLMKNVPAVDFYQNDVLVKANVAYNTCTEFSDIPTANNPCVFTIRPAGALPTSTALANYPTNGASTFTLTNTRIYTVIARGFTGFTDANRRPNVSLLLNR